MPKSEVIAQMQKDILSLQGYKSSMHGAVLDVGLGPIKYAFPAAVFPLGAVHEFFYARSEEATASSGFISGILSPLMRKGGVALWMSTSPTLFPSALRGFEIDADKIIFLTLKNEKELLWATVEALKCKSLSAVVSEISDVSFSDSRRLQLAVEDSGVTSFLLRRNPRNVTTACNSRWRISSLPSDTEEGLPGVGYPRWKIELLKVRNGKPGVWQVEWRSGKFRTVYNKVSLPKDVVRKTA